MATQTPVVFQNRSGLQLFGLLHAPDERRTANLAILILSPGVKMRVGPERLYRRMADRFVEMGFTVLRFDFYGLGDSEGTLPEAQLRDVYNHIEVGRFVNDTLDAMDWMQQHSGTDRFILAGLCGGAITGLLTGSRDPRVAGLLGLGITPVLASDAADASRYMTEGQLEASRKKYIRRLLSVEAWYHLLTLQSDYRLIWRFLTQPLRRRLRKAEPTEAPPQPDNSNPLFAPAFFAVRDSGRPILLVFGGSDRLQWEFQEKFVAKHRDRLTSPAPQHEVHVVQYANHVLTLREWQDEMLERSIQWLEQHFPGESIGPPNRHVSGDKWHSGDPERNTAKPRQRARC